MSYARRSARRALSACAAKCNGAALRPPDPTSAHNPGGAAVFVIILCRLLSALAALAPCSVRSLDGPSQTARQIELRQFR